MVLMGKAGEKAAKTPNRLLPDFKRLGAALQRGWRWVSAGLEGLKQQLF